MSIDRESIRHLEQLARLELSPEEVERITEQLDRILQFVQQLRSVDTSNIEATRQMAVSDEEHLREDEVVDGLEKDVVLEQAPDRAGDYYRVPRVIDRGDSA